MIKIEKLLKWLLLLVGLMLVLAAVAVVIPVDWMVRGHAFLGLGDFPNQPITIYLARSTSLLYAVHGFVMCCVWYKWDELRSLVPIFGAIHIVIGLVMFVVDLTSPMPLYWIVGEGLPVAAVGALMIWMYRKAFPRSE